MYLGNLESRQEVTRRVVLGSMYAKKLLYFFVVLSTKSFFFLVHINVSSFWVLLPRAWESTLINWYMSISI